MPAKYYGLSILLIFTLALFGCNVKGGAERPIERTSTPVQGVQPESPAISVSPAISASPTTSDPAMAELQRMTLNEKIGQMVLIGLNGLSIDEHTQEMIEQYHVGGLILYQPNIQTSEQTLTLLNDFKKANIYNPLPLFLSVDEEGGKVSRMPDEFTNLPTNLAIGQVNNGDFSFQVGQMLAKKIKALGFNVDFAPVLDINSNPDNPVIGDRSFGSTEEVVTTLGVQTMKGIQSQNVISVVKHFPGHGDTSVDSHTGLPIVYHNLDRLNRFELLPFASAIKNGADAVMIAHILFPQIDDIYPASLSPTFITNILREKLHFQGVVFTDDLTMGAIVNQFDIGEAAIQAVNAGSDVLLVCHGYDNELAVLQALRKALRDGKIKEEKINQSVYRIIQLKQKNDLTNETVNTADADSINQAVHDLLKPYSLSAAQK